MPKFQENVLLKKKIYIYGEKENIGEYSQNGEYT
jgi:hypothetical protein